MKDAQVGFNTNVVYQGRTLHIQTEDSGRGRPHVITHLYVSGTILATKRTSYEEFAAEPDARQRVRELMKTQHKAMFRELRAGTHDAVIRRAVEAGLEPDGTRPGWPEVDGEPTVRSRPDAAEAARRVPAETPRVVEPMIRAHKFPSYRPPAPAPGGPDRVSVAIPRERRPGGLRPASDREREGFGKDLITDRSLDEVVLSYLAEELTKDEK